MMHHISSVHSEKAMSINKILSFNGVTNIGQ